MLACMNVPPQSSQGAPNGDPARSYVIGGVPPEQADHRASHLLAQRGGHLGASAVRSEGADRAAEVAKIAKPEFRRVLETKKTVTKSPDGHTALTLLRAGKVLSSAEYDFDALLNQGVKLGPRDADIVERSANPHNPDTATQIAELAAAIRELAARPAPAPAKGESPEVAALRSQNEQFRLAHDATQRQLAELAARVAELAAAKSAEEPKGKAPGKPNKE